MRTLCLFLISSCALMAQDTAVLGGTVLDPKSAPVEGAKVTLFDKAHNKTRSAVSTKGGDYGFEPIPAGTYSLEVAKDGFSPVKFERVTVRAFGRQVLNVKLAAGDAKTPVTIAEGEAIAGDVSVGLNAEQGYIRGLPVDGRNLDALAKIAPDSIAGTGAGFNANGVSSNTNYYSLDGISLNILAGPGEGGVSGGRRIGGIPNPLTMGLSAIASEQGTYSTSLDAVAYANYQTVTYSAEFGRTGGTQVALSSRSGSNQFHGSVYEYYRGTNFNAADWFANASGFGRGEMKQNQFGASVGGRIIPDKTYFFVSYEGLKLTDPANTTVVVPSLASRAAAGITLRPFLNAFPIPNGAVLTNGGALYSAAFSNDFKRNMMSARLDHAITSKHLLFARYYNAPSDANTRSTQYTAPNVVTDSRYRYYGVTGGLTSWINPNTINDLRVNYTSSSVALTPTMDNFGGALLLRESQAFPDGVTSANGNFGVSVIGGAAYSFGAGSRSSQKQYQLADTITMTAGSSSYKLGFDFRASNPTYDRPSYTSLSLFNGYSLQKTASVLLDGSMLSAKALTAVVSSNQTSIYPSYKNFSMFFQDMVRLGAGSILTFGVRWDVNPAPGVRSGSSPFALSSAFSGRLAQNEPLFDTHWSDIAPRIGFVQNIRSTPGKELTLRIGLGMFHDMGVGTVLTPYEGAPFSSVRTSLLPAFPLISEKNSPPALPETAKPYGQISTADRYLLSPLIYSWNFTLERNFGAHQAVSASYIGTRGRKLLTNSSSYSASADYTILRMVTNGAQSDYHGLQAQYRRRLSRRLQTQATWTWSHAIDTSVSDTPNGLSSIFGGDRGNSDFDARHAINWSGSYAIPYPKVAVADYILRDWNLDWVATYRTSLPYDVTAVSAFTSHGDSTTPVGLFAQVRPNYSVGENWVTDAKAPGGKRLNASLFTNTGYFGNGNLARNALKGFGARQVDFGIRRDIPFRDTMRFSIGAQAFNLTNTPSFLNPARDESATLTSPLFGLSTRSASTAYGGAAGSFFRAGGPRSVQFVLRFHF
ncbi:MAG: TonB-dependent receptor [Acidobacteria bacterium]|nr:TonB-dependent receptor [Acidobacteriota bacterium]